MWRAVAGLLEAVLAAGDRRWHAGEALQLPMVTGSAVELLDPGRPWFRCNECGRAWSLELGLLGRISADWWQCPAACNSPESRPRLHAI